MLKRHARHMILILLALVLSLACAPAMAAQVEGLSIDVPNHQGKHVGDNMVDGDTATAWVGGGKGIGPGKSIEIYFETPTALESMRIHNGHQGKGQFNKFRRVTKGVILYPDDTRQKFTLKQASGAQTIKLKPQTVSYLKIVITGVAPSSKDKSMDKKAKVAVSEITIFGEAGESADEDSGDEPDESDELEKVAAEEAPAKNQPAQVKKKAALQPKPAAKKVEKKSEPEPQAKAVVEKPEPKQEPKPKSQPKAEKPVEKKVAPKKSAPKKQAQKPAPKKAAQKKAAPMKKAKAPVSPKGRITYLRSAKPVPAGSDVEIGVINPWLNLELVAQIKRYFALLTTLHDSYPDVFASGIRERERKAFIGLQEGMRSKKEFGKHHIAMLEHIGLFFDKPTESATSATVRVHGPYRYYLENDGYEFRVDTLFTFTKEDGQWLISNVVDK